MTSVVSLERSCRECGVSFVITPAESAELRSWGYELPTRCQPCRAIRSFERKLVADGKPVFDAVCAECGRDTVTPFEPEPGRPVHCPTCHRARKERTSSNA